MCNWVPIMRDFSIKTYFGSFSKIYSKLPDYELYVKICSSKIPSLRSTLHLLFMQYRSKNITLT